MALCLIWYLLPPPKALMFQSAEIIRNPLNFMHSLNRPRPFPWSTTKKLTQQKLLLSVFFFFLFFSPDLKYPEWPMLVLEHLTLHRNTFNPSIMPKIAFELIVFCCCCCFVCFNLFTICFLPCPMVSCTGRGIHGVWVPYAGAGWRSDLLVRASRHLSPGGVPAQASVYLQLHKDWILLLTLACWLLSFGWPCLHGEEVAGKLQWDQGGSAMGQIQPAAREED